MSSTALTRLLLLYQAGSCDSVEGLAATDDREGACRDSVLFDQKDSM